MCVNLKILLFCHNKVVLIKVPSVIKSNFLYEERQLDECSKAINLQLVEQSGSGRNVSLPLLGTETNHCLDICMYVNHATGNVYSIKFSFI